MNTSNLVKMNIQKSINLRLLIEEDFIIVQHGMYLENALFL